MRRDLRGFALSQALALGLLLACLGWVARELEFIFSNHRILVGLRVQDQLGSTLNKQLVGFFAAAWLVHAMLGAIAFLLARSTESALPAALQRRHWLVVGWFIVLAGLAFAANSTWFPASIFTSEDSWWRVRVAGFYPVVAALGVIGMSIGVMLLIARLRVGRAMTTAGVTIATAILILSLAPFHRAVDAAPGTSEQPNVVIIGIDSLRNDLQVPRRGAARTPNLQDFLAQARRFSDTTTPLARTYPSWVSILTGRHPVTTNARYNLMPRQLVNEGETLGDALRTQGYRTIYATDEVRFANFDESFGFDQLITPPVGASDFLLGYIGDMPLVNLVASTAAGGELFPSNHANRAAFVTYRPEHFLRRLDREFEVSGPTFVAIHLTLAHWPYAWAGMEQPSVPEEYRKSYGLAVTAVDSQFGEVLRILGKKGILDNAVVVVLSDHGEALGADDDSMLREVGTGDEIWHSLWGHGTSVMSPNQYQVLLAMRDFGRAAMPGPDQNYDWPVSLEDVRPTLEEFATGQAPTDVDGQSLLPFMRAPDSARVLADRVRFTETDFNTPNTLAGRYEASGLIDEAALYYGLDPESGWVQLREEHLPELISRKQKAAISRSRLLAAIPDPQSRDLTYLLTDRQNPFPKPLEASPDPSRDPDTYRLWSSAEARFRGEWHAKAEPP